MTQIRAVFEKALIGSKKVPNSISSYNKELKSIVVNKGQIHGELRYFLGVLPNSIKSDYELR